VLPGASTQPLDACLTQLQAGAGRPAAGVLAVPVEAGGQPGDPGLDGLLPAPAADVIAAFGLTGQAGEAAQVMASASGDPVSVLLLGVGDRSAAALRRAGAELGRRAAGGATVATTAVAGEAADGIQAFAEGALLGGYRFDLKSAPPDQPPEPPGRIWLASADPDGAVAAVGRATAIAEAVGLARDLANQPSLTKSPQWLADEAIRVTAGRDVTVRVWSPGELAAGGFGGILAVGAGSARPPRLIELSYQPAGARSHVVLVGKGITFDSGGLSLKSNDGMQAMKGDMAAGGAVIAVLSALARLGVPHRVTGLVAAAENLPSGSAYRPGDIITQYGGRTVEVFNTDAEGRLVLADALAYAAAALEPDQIIDLATLTGAARVALGTTHAALYATDDGLAESLIAAGQASGERLWRMPLEDDYAPALASDVADLSHVSRADTTMPGSIIAALFLREFTGGRPWAHLDIAGPGRSAENNGELSKGATGFGTRLLLRLLTQPLTRGA
jgi:leucyl aminopeptidase